MSNPKSGARISSAAVEKATGRPLAQWLVLLDGIGAKTMSHKDIAAHLHGREGVSGWWSQMLTVEYERARGLRALGETAATGFEIGVQKTLPLPVKSVWKAVTSSAGLDLLIGRVPNVRLKPGLRYETEDGAQGEFRTLHEGRQFRLTWQPKEWKQPSTIQVTLVPTSADKTSLRFHQEKLPHARARASMRKRWQHVVIAIEALLDV